MRSPALVVSVHDVCPRTWATCRRLLSALDAAGVRRRSLLVIPAEPGAASDDCPAFGRWLRACESAGDELVQHGLYHRRGATEPPLTAGARRLDALLARGAGEFLGLDQPTAAARLAEGRERLARLGVQAAGFVAPAWLYSPAAAAAVAAAGFRYYTTHLRLRDLATGRDHWSFGLSNRPGPLPGDLAGRGVNEVFYRLHAPAPLLRIAVHPADLDGACPFHHTLAILGRLLRAGRRPVTYLDVVEGRA